MGAYLAWFYRCRNRCREIMQLVQKHRLGQSVAELKVGSRCVDPGSCSCPEVLEVKVETWV